MQAGGMMIAPPWQAVPDPSTGKSYYFNPMTGVTTWAQPPLVRAPHMMMPPPMMMPWQHQQQQYGQPYQPVQPTMQPPMPPQEPPPRQQALVAAPAAPAPPQLASQPSLYSSPDPNLDPEAFEAWQAVQEHLAAGPGARLTQQRLPSGLGVKKRDDGVCGDFIKGKCTRGQYCMLSHGELDMKRPQRLGNGEKRPAPPNPKELMKILAKEQPSAVKNAMPNPKEMMKILAAPLIANARRGSREEEGEEKPALLLKGRRDDAPPSRPKSSTAADDADDSSEDRRKRSRKEEGEEDEDDDDRRRHRRRVNEERDNDDRERRHKRKSKKSSRRRRSSSRSS